MADWKNIVNQYGPMVWRTAFRILGNEPDTADCFQETFVSALRVSRRQRIRNWPALLKRLATVRALDALRARLRKQGHQQLLGDWTTLVGTEPEPPQHLGALELAARLREALTHLPDGQAQVFCLRHFEDLSHRQIARLLDMKTDTVRVTLHRARRQLREMLESFAPEKTDKCETSS